MRLYHGTTEANIGELRVTARGRDGKAVLYLTDNRAYSLFYIRDRDIDFVTCGVDEKGIVHYDEKFENQLKILYQGRAGYIYETEQEAEPTKVNGIYICKENAAVSKVEYISDAYDAIMEEIEKGNVEFLSYHDLTDDQKTMNHKGAVHMIQNVRMNPKKEAFIREYFPEAWLEGQNT